MGNGNTKTLNSIGLILLFLGVCGTIAVVFYSRKPPRGDLSNSPASESNGSWTDSTLPPEDLKNSSRDVEIVWGKVGVLISTSVYEWKHLSLVEQIIILCGFISCVAGLICLIVAGRSTDD
ncbi:MAG: hypothetical protein JO076_08050 [Verrucomicrobia bacterium]|nr:hypothetical protein [Verrucomicrobiota bacterium]